VLVLTSWDDGHSCDLRVAEMLAKYGLAGTFFVPVENREGLPVMNGAEIRELDRNFEIGGHTLTHRYLRRIGLHEQRHEIVEGKRVIEDTVGHAIEGFCFPGGRFDAGVVREVQDAGFRYARTTENLMFKLGGDHWRLPTTLQFYPHGPEVLVKNALRYPKASKFRLVLERVRERDFSKFVENLAMLCARSGQIFHIWGHSWELEKEQLWPSLDVFLRCLSSLATRSLTLAEVVHAQGTSGKQVRT